MFVGDADKSAVLSSYSNKVSDDINEMVEQIQAIQNDISELAGRPISLVGSKQWMLNTTGKKYAKFNTVIRIMNCLFMLLVSNLCLCEYIWCLVLFMKFDFFITGPTW